MKRHCCAMMAALSIVALCGTATPAFSWATGEGSCYAKGDMFASGWLSFYFFGLDATFDYGVHDAISIGASAGYNTESIYQGHARNNYFPLMVRGAFHPFNLDALAGKLLIRNMVDVYAGLVTGFAPGFRTEDEGYESQMAAEKNISKFILREHLGVRYFITEKWSMSVEHSGTLVAIAMGVTYKL